MPKEADVVPIKKYKLSKKPRGQKVTVVCQMTAQEVARMDRISELTGMSARSEIIRVALVRMLQEEERRAAVQA